MTSASVISRSELIVATAVAGLVFGSLYFAALRRSVALFVDGRRRLRPLAWTLGRMTGAAVFLFTAAKLGAAPLLAAFVGFLVARTLALREQRRAD
jgi:hypothetical protein